MPSKRVEMIVKPVRNRRVQPSKPIDSFTYVSLDLQAAAGNKSFTRLLQSQSRKGRRNPISRLTSTGVAKLNGQVRELVEGMTEHHPPRSKRKQAKPRIQRIVHPSMNALLTAVSGVAPPPNVAGFDVSVLALLADAENQLPMTDVVPNQNLGRVAQAGLNPNAPPAYLLEYDPNHADLNFLISSVVHELIHVSTDLNYRKNGLAYQFLNLNMPPGLGPAQIGPELIAQQAILDQNLQDADAVILADNTLLGPLQAHLSDRINNYARAMPGVHYDTVLADMILYLQLNNIQGGPAFKFLRRLVRESNDRRLRDPWWGTKRARRVDPNASWWQIWSW